MKTFVVKITETNVAYARIRAGNKEAAEEQARDTYDTCEDFVTEHISMDEGGVVFEVQND